TRTANGRFAWPARRSGWTVVLSSYPEPKGRAAARATAAHAAHAGLRQVGTLDSSNYASLNPGYDVVFSGVYGSPAEAQAALERARQGGFGAAHVAQIAR
ncbi:MAG: SPOR domain-containing protein, partial [Gaiellaceae bacterium]